MIGKLIYIDMFDKDYLENLQTELTAEALLMIALEEKLTEEASN